MIRALFRGAGWTALWLATMALLAGVSLFVVGSYVMTWPILRKSPRNQRIAASVEFASAGIRLLGTFSDEQLRQYTERMGATDGEPERSGNEQ